MSAGVRIGRADQGSKEQFRWPHLGFRRAACELSGKGQWQEAGVGVDENGPFGKRRKGRRAQIEVEAEVARARMTLEERQVGRYSTGAVTIIGAVIAVGSAVATTTIGGLFGLQNNASNNAAQQQLAREEVQGQLYI